MCPTVHREDCRAVRTKESAHCACITPCIGTVCDYYSGELLLDELKLLDYQVKEVLRGFRCRCDIEDVEQPGLNIVHVSIPRAARSRISTHRILNIDH